MSSLTASALIAVAIITISIVIGFRVRTWILSDSPTTVCSLDLPLGYASASLVLVLSMRMGAGLAGGSILLAMLAFYALAKFPNSALQWEKGTLLSVGVIASFVVAVGAAYFPLLWSYGTAFHPPQIFDAPKHILTLTALQISTSWPPQSPFMPGLGFAYNFAFYSFPAALIYLAGDPRLGVSILPWLAMISAANALCLTLGVATKLGTPRVALPVVALSATWLGGFTPLLVEGRPSMGFRLPLEKVVTSHVWADEPFISAVFVPQHLFAATCVLGTVYLALCEGAVWRRAALAAVLSLAGSLASLILLPHASATLAVIVLLMAAQSRSLSQTAKAAAVLLAYGASLSPFFIEAIRWQSGTGSLFGYPPDTRTTLAVLASIGPVAILAGIGFTAAFRKGYAQGATILLIPVIISIAASMILHYSDAAFKSTMLLRTLLPCIAGLGWMAVYPVGRRHWVRLGAYSFGLFCIVLNAPAVLFFAASPLKPFSQNEQNFLQMIQAAPSPLFFDGVSDQWVASLAVKQTIFDFRPIRSDAYLPPQDRAVYDKFFSSLGQGLPAPLGSPSFVIPSDAVKARPHQSDAPAAEAMGFALYRSDRPYP